MAAIRLEDIAAAKTIAGTEAMGEAIASAEQLWLEAAGYKPETETERELLTRDLNNEQSVASADGTYTYVLSHRDPGIHNWLNTMTMPRGYLYSRFQGVAGETGD